MSPSPPKVGHTYPASPLMLNCSATVIHYSRPCNDLVGVSAMIGTLLCKRRRWISSTPLRVPIRLFFASLLLPAARTAATPRALHPTFVAMGRHSTMPASTAQRRSARLQKRPLSASSDAAPPPTSSNEYSSMKVTELRDLLRERGLPTSGVKASLIERLLAACGGPSPATADDDKPAEEARRAQPERKRACGQKSQLERIPQQSAGSLKTPPATAPVAVGCLPRTRELQLQSSHGDTKTNLAVIGVDEAGRGPLAG